MYMYKVFYRTYKRGKKICGEPTRQDRTEQL